MQTPLQHQQPARREVLRAALALTLGSLADVAAANTGLARLLPLQANAAGTPDEVPASSEAAFTLYF